MEYDALKLENQLCFPLYACAREIVKQYKPMLDELNLTYTQYLVMLVLWEKNCETVKGLGEALRLDSGTLTPLLKRLEAAGYITRSRAVADERNLIVALTYDGIKLKDRALSVPSRISGCIDLSPEEALTLYTLLYKVLDSMND